jgi:hypothetical protein
MIGGGHALIVAHVAGAPLEEMVVPLLSAGGLLAVVARAALARLRLRR